MIRRINLASFFCRSCYLQQKNRVLTASVSSSAVCWNKKSNAHFLDLKKELTEKNVEKYQNTFGNIESFETMFEKIKDDPEDIAEYEELKAAPGKNLGQYIREIKSLLEKHDYNAAVKLLKVDVRNDRIKDTRFLYKVLINYNAKIGDLKEAYKLFTDFKKRGGIVTGAMYTSLFNACANCKNSFLALEKAEAVRESMNKNAFHKVNVSNYNAMMKAYGRHGDISTCLKIMDEVLEKRGHVKSESYSFLYQACISDANSGLRHAFLVWRKMLQNRTKPSIFSFNSMLRCIRDCSLGEVLLIPGLIKQICKESEHFYKTKIKIKNIGDKEITKVLKIPRVGSDLIKSIENESTPQEQLKQNIINLGNIETNEPKLLSADQRAETTVSQIVENQAGNSLSNSENESDSTECCLNVKEDIPKSQGDFELPNLLALKPTLGSLVDFKGMSSPEHRFMLVGGVDGFLKTMTEFGVKPDIKTFTLMLSLIPSAAEAEEKLISVAGSHSIELDTGFYNVLIKRRILRKENHLIKDCLNQMYARNLKPDILTFGILSLGCTTQELAVELIENIHKHGFRLNSEMITSLLKNAQYSRDMNYVLTILKAAKEDEVIMDPKCLAQVSHTVNMEKRRRWLEKNKMANEENELFQSEIKSAQTAPSQV